jgi:hypothetical protein
MHVNQRFYSTPLVVIALTAFPVAAGFGQGTAARQNAAGYPVHSKAGGIGIGAEYMVHSFGGDQADRMLLAEDFLVVEVALYPERGSQIEVNARKFTLRLNHRKDVLFPQSPGMVAASIKYPDWRRKPQLTAAGGIGDRGIIVGHPPAVARFPGDRRADRLPAPPRTDSVDKPAETVTADPAELVQKVALPEGPAKHPVSGYLFFPYGGKLKSLKSVELVVDLGSEPLVLRLK